MADERSQQERIAANEMLFRTVNQQIVSLNEVLEQVTDKSFFVCECSRTTCADPVVMTLAEYAEIRSNPRRFFISASCEHLDPEAERVVEETDDYVVVEKRGEAGEVAEKGARN